MKRSEINSIMREADAFIKSHQFFLPPFAYWTPEMWRAKGEEASEIVEHQLGWDITDFGLGNYRKDGLFLFTIRNGGVENLRTGQGKTYAEKILIVGVEQVTPLHFHWHKVEDIINRGGGRLALELYNATVTGELLDSPIVVSRDGVSQSFKPGETVILERGESVTLPNGLYHTFWALDRRVLVGEVSKVNDDTNDTRFYKSMARFPDIEEDEPPLYLLVGDYRHYCRSWTSHERNRSNKHSCE